MQTHDPFSRAAVPQPVEPKAAAQEMPSGKCDCTVTCGDDPWIRDGRAEPCEDRKLYIALKQAAKERDDALEALRQELTASPTKTEFTVTRETLLKLVGTPQQSEC